MNRRDASAFVINPNCWSYRPICWYQQLTIFFHQFLIYIFLEVTKTNPLKTWENMIMYPVFLMDDPWISMVHHHEIPGIIMVLSWFPYEIPGNSWPLMARPGPQGRGPEVGPFGLRTLRWQEHGHGLRREAGPGLRQRFIMGILWGFVFVCGTTWHVVFI